MDEMKNDRYQMQELLSVLSGTDSVLLFSHILPDGDTIGSALALKMALETKHKQVTLVLDGTPPESLFFLPDLYAFRKPEEVPLELAQKSLALSVDVSSPDRLGASEKLFRAAASTAQLDHHGTNPAFAQTNVIDGDAPASAIVTYRLVCAMNVELQKEMAICLYTALATDTGNFVYDATNSEAFYMMGELMKTGFPLAKCSRLLFRRKAREHVKLLGRALQTLQFDCGGEVAGMFVTQEDLSAAGATGEHADGIVDYAIDVGGVKLAYLARETDEGHVKFSLRALEPYHVDQIASCFGGGGHSLAAGCTICMPLSQAVAKIKQALIAAHEGDE